jgi:hypothetical protein
LTSNKALGGLLVEPKTLGWEHSKKSFENVFENLGVVLTPLKCFKKWFWTKRSWAWRKNVWWFSKEKMLVIMYSPGAINPCNHITPVWDGA